MCYVSNLCCKKANLFYFKWFIAFVNFIIISYCYLLVFDNTDAFKVSLEYHI